MSSYGRPYRRRSRFSRTGGTRTVVKVSTGVQSKNRTKCHGCGSYIEVGEQFTRLRLKSAFRSPCPTCSTKPKGAKRFHTRCVPSQPDAQEKAMGYDRNARTNVRRSCVSCGYDLGTASPKYCPSCGGDPYTRKAASAIIAPPPPKPKSAQDLTLEAMVSLEAALVAQLKQRKRAMTPELEKDFKTFQNIKQRILRPGSAGEEEAATVVGLQRLIKMALS